MPDVRLIDVNAALDAATLFDWFISSVSEDDTPVWTNEHIDELFGDFLVIPKDTSTVDAQPVKHGHWIETRRYRDADGCIVSDYSCSECGSVLRETNPDDRDSELYCYRCGAKMDGDADETE